MSGRLAGKVAIITGAGGGIGAASARRFVDEGASLGLADINADALQGVVAEIEATGGNVVGVAGDLNDAAVRDELVATVIDRFGTVDILYNNAGIILGGSIEDLTDEQWDHVMATNVKSQVMLIQRVVPIMKAAGGGNIVNGSSLGGTLGSAGMVAYSAAKVGLVGATRTLALDLADDNIRVNAIVPGVIDTNMPRSFLAYYPADQHESMLAGFVSRHLIKRMGRPEEVASAALFLASEDSSFITGHALPVDGGYTAW